MTSQPPLLSYEVPAVVFRVQSLTEQKFQLKLEKTQFKKEFHFCGCGHSLSNRAACVYNWYSPCIMIYLSPKVEGIMDNGRI